MKIFGVLFVFGLMDACLGRTMKPATIKKRFREAKYGQYLFCSSCSRVCEICIALDAVNKRLLKHN